MMAGNPNWWSMNGSMHPQSHHQFHVMYADHQSNSSSNTSTAAADDDHHRHHPNQDFPPVRSWSQLLLGGEEDRFGASLFQQQKKLENWEDQVLLNLNPSFTRINNPSHLDHVKQEEINPQSNYHNHHHDSNSNWLHQGIPVSPPSSCITSLSNNILNFSGAHKAALAAPAEGKNHRHNQDHSSECNSMSSGGVSKKARVQHSSPQPALKVRKEKLGDRITTLHQLVSPFGKTDTASVLSEAIGYIRFLQGQIEALSSPYMRNASTVHHQHSDSQSREEVKELRSRGLCLVPISCTQNVGNENGADYWAPAALGGGF